MEVSGKRTDTSQGECDSKLGNVCEPCQGDTITTQASGYCKDCREYMCDTCFRHHLRGKLCRHHVLIDEDMANLHVHEGKESERKCYKHNGETTKFYCRKHEVVGCGDCMVLEHNVCKLEYVKDASTNFHENEAFKALVTKIEILTSKTNEIKDNRHEQEQNNKTMLKKALEDIRKFRADINRYLNAVEADVISEAKRIMSDNNKLLNKLAQDCKELSFKIENLKQRLNTELYEDNVLFINTVEWKPRVTELEEEIALAHSKTMKRVEFVCDQQLRDFVISSKQLGTLTISQTVPCRQTTQHENYETHKPASKSGHSYYRKEKGSNDSSNIIPRVDSQSPTGSVPAKSKLSGTGQSAVHHQPDYSYYSPTSLIPGADCFFVLMGLRFLAKGDFSSEVADLHGVSKARAAVAIEEFVRSVNVRLTNIRFPTDRNAVNELKRKFYQKCRIPNIIGAVDGTLIPIQAPAENEPAYVCRKIFHALNVQAVCDVYMRFTDVVAMWPGSQHDSAIFNSCGLKDYLERSGAGMLLGDSGYPLKSFLLTPKLNPSTPQEENFNQHLCRGRMAIERAFGILKSRFRCLHRTGGVLQFKPGKCSEVVVACMRLHNMCVDRGMPEPQFVVANQCDNGPHLNLNPAGENRNIRDNIIRLF